MYADPNFVIDVGTIRIEQHNGKFRVMTVFGKPLKFVTVTEMDAVARDVTRIVDAITSSAALLDVVRRG